MNDNAEIKMLSLCHSLDYSLKNATDVQRDDTVLVRYIVKRDWMSLQYASYRLKNDMATVMSAYSKGPFAIQYASTSLLDNKKFVMGLDNGLVLRFVSDRLNDDSETVQEMLFHDGLSLKFVSNRLKDDWDTVSLAVTQNGNALQYASDTLRNDREIVINAVCTKFGNPLQYASDILRNDMEIVMLSQN